jgi:hypothetical protein
MPLSLRLFAVRGRTDLRTYYETREEAEGDRKAIFERRNII